MTHDEQVQMAGDINRALRGEVPPAAKPEPLKQGASQKEVEAHEAQQAARADYLLNKRNLTPAEQAELARGIGEWARRERR